MKEKINDINLIKEAFNIFLNNHLDINSLISFATLNNIDIEDLMFQINKYIKRSEEPCMTPEQREKYLALKPRKKNKNEIELKEKHKKVDNSVLLGKEAYEALIESHYDKASLKPIMNRVFISEETLIDYIRNYRQRVVDPKPTLEQEIEYIDGVYRHNKTYKIIYDLLDASLDNLDDKIKMCSKEVLLNTLDKFNKTLASRKYTYQLAILRDKINEVFEQSYDAGGYHNQFSKKIGDILEEYILSNYYVITTVLIKHDIVMSTFYATTNHYKDIDPKFNTIYQKYLIISKERQDKFLILIQAIFDKMEQNKYYNLIDLCMDIDTTIEDFLFMINRIVKLGFISTGMAKNLNNMIGRYVTGNSRTIMNQEKLAALKYTYNGVMLTPELKKEVVAFLNLYNAPITSITIILTFEKYVRGEINFSYQM